MPKGGHSASSPTGEGAREITWGFEAPESHPFLWVEGQESTFYS